MIQRLAVRTIFFVKKSESITYKFKEQNILTFHQIYYFACNVHVFKYLDNYIFKHFTRNTRASNLRTLDTPNFRKDTSRKQFCFCGPTIFNTTVKHFGNSILDEKKPRFKMKLKRAILEGIL